MSNNLLTLTMITREALRLYRNSGALIQMVDTRYASEFGKAGEKIGSTLNVRLPNDYITRTGPTAVPQATNERTVPLIINNQTGVDLSFSSVDLTLSLDDFNKRILAPAVNRLVGKVTSNLMNIVEGGTGQGGAGQFIHAVDGSNNTITPTASTWLQAGAYLDSMSAPTYSDATPRVAILDPKTQARTVNALSGFFNPQTRIGEQTTTGQMAKRMLNLDWYMDQSTILHTAGTQASGTVGAAGQTGATLTVTALTGTLAQGDIITVAGVNSVNKVTGLSTRTPMQFVITAACAAGTTVLPIYPAITPFSGGLNVAYQTVDNSPASGAAWTLATNASETFRKNLVFVPEAITMATVDLPLMGKGVVDEARENYQGVSMRMITTYDVINDLRITRLDMLYGMALLRPEWVVAVADAQ